MQIAYFRGPGSDFFEFFVDFDVNSWVLEASPGYSYSVRLWVLSYSLNSYPVIAGITASKQPLLNFHVKPEIYHRLVLEETEFRYAKANPINFFLSRFYFYATK